MIASEPSRTVQVTPADDPSDVIEVVGTRANQSLKIDRRTYRVQQTPHSAQKDAVQLMRGLPAVSLTPDDQIMLLGSGNAKIFVDGRPYSGNSREYLRTLHGSDIERIEIITNPSAQYSSEGTAGIVNFVLRKKTGDGATGNASVEASSYRRILADSTIKYKHGRGTYELQGGGNVGALSRSTYHKRRSVEAVLVGPATVNTEDGGRVYEGTVGRLSAKVSYDVDPKTTVSAKLGGGGGHDNFTTDAAFRGLTSNFASFSERQRLDSVAHYFTGDFTLDHKGTKEGETINAAAQFYWNPHNRDVTDTHASNASNFSFAQLNRSFTGHSQIDWTHPLRKDKILTLGGSWDITGKEQQYRFSSLGTDGSLGANTQDQYNAWTSTIAGYATFQQPVGRWVVVPGLRIEQSSRHIASPGLPDVATLRTNLFPTLHAKQTFKKHFDLTLSYSKRIDRVPLEYLRPYSAVEDVVTIFHGNPDLNDQCTDAFEVNLHYHAGKVDAGVILYDRETSGLWSRSYSVNPAGISLYMYVNSGHRRDSGAEFDVSTPIARRLKANGSLNLFSQRSPSDTDMGTRIDNLFRYTTNGTLEWDAHDRGKVPGDVAQLQWIYNSRSREFQVRDMAWSELSLSYTHSFSRTLSLSSTFTIQQQNRREVVAPLAQEYSAERREPEFKVKLLKTF